MKTLITLALAAMLAACGGGGADVNEDAPSCRAPNLAVPFFVCDAARSPAACGTPAMAEGAARDCVQAWTIEGTTLHAYGVGTAADVLTAARRRHVVPVGARAVRTN